MDKLDAIFLKQETLQKKLGTDVSTQEFYTMMTLAAIDELCEALRETPWKPWKKQQTLNTELVKEELVDVLHFFVNLCIAVGLDSQELYQMYYKKNLVNEKRKQEGY